MSLILALDTSTDACSVALNADGVITSLFEVAAKSHTQRLLPMVDELLKAKGCELTDLDAIAFGRGPGSFTGLRICAGIVQGLAFGASLPVIPVSTLEAMALGFYRANPDIHLPLAVALDARMNEVYWGLCARSGELVEPLVAEQVISPDVVVASTEVARLHGDFIGIGPGWHYPAMQTLATVNKVLNVHPHAENMALIAAKLFAEGKVVSALEAQPVYLRDSVSWQKRQRIRDSNDFLV
ncbi:tRNA (adenosine(37)-N6)-threonylcarbamoyltransferase complex dimerization subunit type 1 TsaB [Cellvibrio mixtus]|uniref:tRNA (adenosine(37)-N6)-threonylcarbamoyltransferase complex dimerization subunit type 1 TsaB n=1 Tax=Cellvibrio mixtus TaxID=39650 RepID=UPI000587B956|nr:tRNA (adenosine(37)-N6)-threonylcarbamoyltransferase complex dimerization subunit type 1 TsaB [Cellvibrio mixtus]